MDDSHPMSHRTISLQLPEEIATELEARTQSNGKNETEIILDALAQAWGLPTSTSASNTITMADFQRQLHAIKTHVEALSEHQTALQIRHNVALQVLDNQATYGD